MHEMSVAQQLLHLIRRNLNGANEEDVRSVRLRIGIGAGIVTESLRFCFEALVASSSFRHASLLIEETPFTIHCQACGSVSPSEPLILLCPACNSHRVQVLSGTEMELIEIEVADVEEKII
ncbi:MAG: hydrogenase maturation nickel metallochaperone HypA [Ignavibacteriae bacterium]|nr:hydrogenase maturation nickel metallochaperone HypA [Ignavibacteriota bacterium]